MQWIKQDSSFLQSHTIKTYNWDQSTSHEKYIDKTKDGKGYKKQLNKLQVSSAHDWDVISYCTYHKYNGSQKIEKTSREKVKSAMHAPK